MPKAFFFFFKVSVCICEPLCFSMICLSCIIRRTYTVQSARSRFQKIYSVSCTISHYMKLYMSTAASDGLPRVKARSPRLRTATAIMHPSIILSILKGTLANLIIDSPDAAVLRRGWNNLLSLRMVWPRASSALADKWGRGGREKKKERGLKSFIWRKKAKHTGATRSGFV